MSRYRRAEHQQNPFDCTLHNVGMATVKAVADFRAHSEIKQEPMFVVSYGRSEHASECMFNTFVLLSRCLRPGKLSPLNECRTAVAK